MSVYRIFAIGALLLLAACQNPNGSTNWGNTVLLGAGAGAAAAGLAGILNDVNNSQSRQDNYGYGVPVNRRRY